MNLRRFRTVGLLGLAFCLTLPARAQQKPLTKEQVLDLVRDQLGDESGAKAIQQRGIDFEPADDFIQSLKDAGASEAFIQALRSAKRPNAASGPAKKPLTQVQVLALLAGQVTSHRIVTLIEERGIDFEPQEDYLGEVQAGGGQPELLKALKTAKVIKPAAVDPAAEARQAELRQHLKRGAQLLQDRQYAQAEEEYRAAAQLDPQNADLQVSLSHAYGVEQKWDDSINAARQALRLEPENDRAHNNLGAALMYKGDVDGAIAEFREAIHVNPGNDKAHQNLGLALARKNDLDGAIAEYREALRVNPNMDMVHNDLGLALGKKGDEDGATAEFRAALRVNPKNYYAHDNLGKALGRKGDVDGAIAEFRDALTQNSNYAPAHFNLALMLYKQHDRQGALSEFRAAYTLDPENPRFKAAYEKLLHEPE